MKIEYVPLLRVQRELQGLPRNHARFQQYLRTVLDRDRNLVKLPSLLAMNPMGKDHVTARLDALLALDADGVAAQAASEASARLADEPGDVKFALVIADDLMGGWTNRYADEFTFRFGPDQIRFGPSPKSGLPRWLEHDWITGVLWSSEAPSERGVREATLTAIYRRAYGQRHGPARTLLDMLVQEGHVMALAGCIEPVLEEEDLAYTREVLAPFLNATDMRTAIECLFGDEPGRTLSFTPRGLSPWAGLALALRDARLNVTLQPSLPT
jgi:hypothetical protein